MADKMKPGEVPPEMQCGAKLPEDSKSQYTTCHRRKGYQTPHPGWGRCKSHGGCTPSGIQSAAREELASRHLLFGQSIEIDPGEGLLQEVARSNGFIKFIERVLEEKGIDDAAAKDPARLILELSDKGWQAQAWVEIWQKERIQFARNCKLALDAGIAERQIRIVEQFAELIGDLVYNLMIDLGVDPEEPRNRQIAHRQLMLVGQKMSGSTTPLALAPTLGA